MGAAALLLLPTPTCWRADTVCFSNRMCYSGKVCPSSAKFYSAKVGKCFTDTTCKKQSSPPPPPTGPPPPPPKSCGAAMARTTCGSACWTQNTCNSDGSVTMFSGMCNRMCFRGNTCPKSALYYDSNTKKCYTATTCKQQKGSSKTCTAATCASKGGTFGAFSSCKSVKGKCAKVAICGKDASITKSQACTANGACATGCNAARPGYFNDGSLATCPQVRCARAKSGCRYVASKAMNAFGASNQCCSSKPCGDLVCDCAGSWSTWTACPTGTALSAASTVTRSFTVTVKAASNGKACAANDGDKQTKKCPVTCVGAWTLGSCTKQCGGGTTTGTYAVTTAAANGGRRCSAKAGDTATRKCNVQNCQKLKLASKVKCAQEVLDYGSKSRAAFEAVFRTTTASAFNVFAKSKGSKVTLTPSDIAVNSIGELRRRRRLLADVQATVDYTVTLPTAALAAVAIANKATIQSSVGALATSTAASDATLAAAVKAEAPPPPPPPPAMKVKAAGGNAASAIGPSLLLAIGSCVAVTFAL